MLIIDFVFLSPEVLQAGEDETSHTVGCGSIMIHLAQSYVINPMRMYSWDVESQGFAYYIETSVDEKNWFTVADSTSEFHCWWQVLF